MLENFSVVRVSPKLYHMTSLSIQQCVPTTSTSPLQPSCDLDFHDIACCGLQRCVTVRTHRDWISVTRFDAHRYLDHHLFLILASRNSFHSREWFGSSDLFAQSVHLNDYPGTPCVGAAPTGEVLASCKSSEHIFNYLTLSVGT